MVGVILKEGFLWFNWI